MKVIVCIKQVPASGTCLDEGGNLNRSGASVRLNPGDLYALEAGLLIAEQTGGSVTALTMGPQRAVQVLQTALAMGADQAVLLSDPAFRGADVYATGYTLSQGIGALGAFDVVICGQQSTDGDTAQLPFSLAKQLEIPAVGWVKLLEIREGKLLCRQELSLGTQEAEVSGPCLLAVGQGIGTPRIPSLRSQLRAKGKEVLHLGLQNLKDQNGDHYGAAASPTRVIRVQEIRKQAKQSPLILSSECGAEKILTLIKEAEQDD